MKPTAIVIDAIIKPMEITIKDPAIAFVNVYTAIIYGIYYSFFEVGFLDPNDQKISRRC
jgi:DHA1 family multidrug resistance protein-like MFS transporter